MSIKNKLQIYLITYNRKSKLEYTLKNIFADNSPIKDFDITILDNASTDGTSELIDEYCAIYPNIKHIRHKINIGGNANICRAFEMGASCGKEYFWILCDDDKYDFSNWNEVEERIEAQDDVICLADYVFPSIEKKTNPAYQIFQLTFVPAGIYKSSLVTDDVLVNMYDSIIMMFQQACIGIKCINESRKIHVLSKPIVFNGLHFPDKVDDASVSFKRGGDEKWVMKRKENTTWILGFTNIITLLKDKKLQEECMEAAIPYKDIYASFENFYMCLVSHLFCKKKLNYFLEIYNMLPMKRKKEILKIYFYLYVKHKIKMIIQWFFALKNSDDKQHKIIQIFGIKIKFKRNKKS